MMVFGLRRAIVSAHIGGFTPFVSATIAIAFKAPFGCSAAKANTAAPGTSNEVMP